MLEENGSQTKTIFLPSQVIFHWTMVIGRRVCLGCMPVLPAGTAAVRFLVINKAQGHQTMNRSFDNSMHRDRDTPILCRVVQDEFPRYLDLSSPRLPKSALPQQLRQHQTGPGPRCSERPRPGCIRCPGRRHSGAWKKIGFKLRKQRTWFWVLTALSPLFWEQFWLQCLLDEGKYGDFDKGQGHQHVWDHSCNSGNSGKCLQTKSSWKCWKCSSPSCGYAIKRFLLDWFSCCSYVHQDSFHFLAMPQHVAYFQAWSLTDSPSL